MSDLNKKEIILKQKEYIINKLKISENESYKNLFGNEYQNFFTSSANESIIYYTFI